MAGKADIVEHVTDSVDGITKKQATEAVDAAFGAVAKALGGGDKVQVPGFGTFQLSHRAARKGRNPQTGEQIRIRASKSLKFRPAMALRTAAGTK